MQALDFPAYDFRLKNSENKPYIFDPIRKKFIHLTPEEWVRQHNSDGSIFLIVECKRPNVTITQTTFDQIARYNLTLQAALLMVTNGLHHYYCAMDFEQERYQFLKEIPNYSIK